MSRSYGTLLTDHAYTAAGYSAAETARLSYRNGQPTTASLANTYPLIALVGDMVSDPDDASRDSEEGSAVGSRFTDVSNMVVTSNCDYFMCLGDNVYNSGQLANYQSAYEYSFGRVNGKVLPMPGNHEYITAGAADYFTYFGQKAGIAGNGYYAVNVANWRIYCLNSNSSAYVAPGSAQMLWLIDDLAKNRSKPKIAAWHHPRWTDGNTGSVTDDAHYDYLWQQLYADGKVQIILGGHDHNYQRWDTIKTTTPAGNTTGLDGGGNSYPPTTDATHGITQFVVGCGGNNFFTLNPPRPGNTSSNLNGGPGNAGRSTFGIDRAFGVLFLRLGPTSYDWLFRTVAGLDLDSGTRSIHS